MNKRLRAASLILSSIYLIVFFSLRVEAMPPAQEAETPEVENNLLDEMAERAFRFFWDEANPDNGLIKDRANNFTDDTYNVASIASVGFGLTAVCIGAERGWVTEEEAYERALTTLTFFRDEMENVHGFYYHFVDLNTGERVWDSEISSIDTALFLYGALFAGACMPDTEVAEIANELYERADFEWMRTDDGSNPDQLLLGHGWTPENGFIPYRWDTYSEGMMLYLLALGAPNPIPDESWLAWRRLEGTYRDYTTFRVGPLFTHQFPQGYVDYRDQVDALGFNYFTSSVNATLANRQFTMDLADRFDTYDEEIWGLSASDGPDGYKAYGAPPGRIEHDGTVSPAAVAGSIVFAPEVCILTLEAMRERYGDLIWGRYGFVSGFNVDRDWYDRDVIGLELGISLIMIQNYQDEYVWRTFMAIPAIQTAMEKAGFTAVE